MSEFIIHDSDCTHVHEVDKFGNEVFSNDDPITQDDFDYAAYEKSLSNRMKQAWILIQVTLMTIYMIIGIRAYSRVFKGWSRIKSLFVLQTITILYLAINEFTNRHIHGIFIIYLFTQYSLFLTFCLVVDSCLTDAQLNNWTSSKAMIFNKVYRTVMHLVTLGLFIASFWMKDCDERIYPFNFITVTCIVLCHQMYDLYLKKRNYLLDLDNLPPISSTRLRYNKELFKSQTDCLFWANLIFGVLSICTVATGFFIMNQQHKPDATQHLLCMNGNEWIYLSLTGNAFGTFHQILILMQINITQFVMVKIPRNMGIFDVDQKHDVAMALRSKLLVSINNEVENDKAEDGGDAKGDDKPQAKFSLAKLASQIKLADKQDDDNFRI